MKNLILFLLLFLIQTPIVGQTRADVMSQRWKGVSVDTIIGNSKYEDTVGSPKGFPFLLYNIGTGRFVIQGGDWAMEGRLFYSDFGRTLYLCNNGRINSGITEENISETKNSFCVRPPEPFGKNWSTDYPEYNFTTLMDGSIQKNGYNQQWNFERVEGETGDTCTYYMYQTWSKAPGVRYYLGAAYGECHNSTIGKGDGELVFLDDDRCSWTTAEVRGVKTEYSLEIGDKVELQKLYQWRLISLDEFLLVLNGDGVGLNPSVSILVTDRDFARNDINFFKSNGWKVSRLGRYSYDEGSDRYTYSWGDYTMGLSPVQKNNQQSRDPRIVEEPWDSPVRLKTVFDSWHNGKSDLPGGKKNAKYGFLQFEGVGTVTSDFQVTKPGWYEITCNGFCQSDFNDAYLFAHVILDADTVKPEIEFTEDYSQYSKIELKRISNIFEKDSYDECLATGKELLINADNYKRKIWVLVTEDDFNSNKKTIRVGIRKENATKSENKEGGYYDKDWVCVDDFRVFYMGLSPVFFYDDLETLDYLDDINHRDLYLSNEYPKRGYPGQYNGSISLQRKFTTNQWNTFSFILPLTGEQVRNTFGEKSELLELDGIGTLSKNENIIDFRTVNLITSDFVIFPNKLYLLKPTKDAIYGKNPRNEIAYYYDLGRISFSIKEEDENYKNSRIDLSIKNHSKGVDSYLGRNNGIENVVYTQTANYSLFRVDRNGFVLDRVGDVSGTYTPKGSYILSNGKMYELSRDTPIKGFRGWITLEKSIFDNPTGNSKSSGFSIDGIIDNDGETFISNLVDDFKPIKEGSGSIYNLIGRKFSSIRNLRRGEIYIINGKKVLIR